MRSYVVGCNESVVCIDYMSEEADRGQILDAKQLNLIRLARGYFQTTKD